MDVTRRDMLKLMGAGVGAAVLNPMLPQLPLAAFAAPNADFRIQVGNANTLKVFGGDGGSLGKYSVNNLSGVRAYGAAESNQARVLTLADAALSYNSVLPAALMPLSQHVFDHFDGRKYSMTTVVETAPDFDAAAFKPISVDGPLGVSALTEPIGPNAIYIGNYVITGGCSWGYVSGCISRNVTHANFRINTRSGQQICDFHFAAWYASRRPCVGIYESVRRRINHCLCTSSIWDTIFYALLAGLAAYGIAVWLIPAIASALTVPAFALLVAIPGVPPPP